jgi:hypothetical protein
MVGKKNKKRTPSQRGSPIQEVSSPRRTESSPSRRSPRQTNSPQSGNEGNSTMNIQNSSGLAKGAAQIQLANTINDRSRSIILLVTPGALPKFHT